VTSSPAVAPPVPLQKLSSFRNAPKPAGNFTVRQLHRSSALIYSIEQHEEAAFFIFPTFYFWAAMPLTQPEIVLEAVSYFCI